jgi:hypothetical protein
MIAINSTTHMLQGAVAVNIFAQKSANVESCGLQGKF